MEIWRLMLLLGLFFSSEALSASVVDSLPARTIVGDTAFWTRHQNSTHQQLGLLDFQTHPADFLFRFEVLDVIVQVVERGDSVRGTIYPYFRPFRYTRFYQHEYLPIRSDSIEISPHFLRSFLLPYLKNHPVRSDPPQDSISGWQSGFDGTTYFIEYATDTTYDYRTYWCPYSFDSIPEAVRVEAFKQLLMDSLRLNQHYTNLRDDLPAGNYWLFGGPTVMTIPTNQLWVGYHGNTRFPYGLHAAINLASIFNHRITNLYGDFTFRSNQRSEREWLVSFRKYLVIKNRRFGSGYLQYGYRRRRSKPERLPQKIGQSHRVDYQLTIPETRWSLISGVERFHNSDRSHWGGVIGFGHRFPWDHFVYLEGHSTLFARQQHHYYEITTKVLSAQYRDRPSLSVALHYDRFAQQNAFGGSLYLGF